MARNKYPEITVKRIVDTSLKLFLSKGYEQTTIQDIVNDLGDLSKGAIYHHFKSKEDIMDAVAEKLYEETNLRLYELENRKDCTGLEKLQLMMTLSLENPNQKKLVVAAPNLMKNPRFFTEQVISGHRDVAPIIEKFIREGISDGSIETDFPKELSEVLILLLNIWLNPMVFTNTQEELSRKFEFFQQFSKAFGVPILNEKISSYIEDFRDLIAQSQK